MNDSTTTTLFLVGIVILLAVDLLMQRLQRSWMTVRQAILVTGAWISLALLLGVWIWAAQGAVKGLQFYTSYAIEYALSVDNLFIFVMIFEYFKINRRNQHRVLFWGVFGALIFRGIFIILGIALINRFAWLLYVFGAFLLVTGLKMLTHHEQSDKGLEDNKLLRFLKRLIPVTSNQHGSKFSIREAGRRVLTPLAMALIMIELMDIVFAVDSIPAAFAVTQDRFIIFTSNIAAILGLRSLYFVLSEGMTRFHYLKLGLAFILIFIGVKMITAYWWHPPILLPLAVVILVLAISVVASVMRKAKV